MRSLKTLLIVAGIISATESMAQTAIGQWRDHFPYRRAVAIAEGDNGRLYCATNTAVLGFDPSTNEIERFTKVNVLSDVNIQTIVWNPILRKLLVCYKNGNLDLVGGSTSANLGDIERSNLVGDKAVYHAYFDGPLAYLSCGFGIVVVDLEALEVRDTWFIGPGGTQLTVNATEVFGDSIYAATKNGLYAAWRYEPNLAAFTNWHKRLDIPNPNGTFNSVLGFGGKLFASYDHPSLDNADTLYYNDGGGWQRLAAIYGQRVDAMTISADDQLVLTHRNSVTAYDASLAQVASYWDLAGEYMNPAKALRAVSGDYWIADKETGLRRLNDAAQIQPDGPKTVNAIRMDSRKGALYVSTGGVAGNWTNQFKKEGLHHFVNGDWQTTDISSDPLMLGANVYGGAVNDVMVVVVDPSDPDHAYAGSWDDGLLELRGRHVVNIFNANNSSLENEQGLTEEKVNVAGLDYDESGNIWMTNANTQRPVAVRTSTGSWYSFNPGAILGGNTLVSDILAAKNGLKWIVRPRSNGMFVFNDGGTIGSPGDDQYKVINTFDGQGELPSIDVFSIAEDIDGEIWVGTGKGVAVFYAPDAVFGGGDWDSQQILIEQDGNVQILLETEAVSAIEVDGANRKWLGTQSSGAFLVSADGTQQIHHFTTDNSPLPSNNITSIAIDELTGEVFIGTDQGIISYRGDAIAGGLSATCATVFPNPVHPTYTGPIAITGLVFNSDVKITDIAGNLVYHTTSLGGQAIWPGTDMSGNRVATGVYLALAADPTGTVKCNTRILVTR